MSITKDSYQGIIGRIKRSIYDHNGKLVDSTTCKNIVTYSATNLLAKAITGDASVAISHIRIGGTLTAGYSGGNKFSDQTTSREDKDMYYAGSPNPGNDTIVTVPATFLRYESEETVDLTPDQQTTNVAVFQATLDDSTGNGYTFDEIGMFGASDTVMFAHAKIDPIGKTSAFSIDYEWTVVFR